MSQVTFKIPPQAQNTNNNLRSSIIHPANCSRVIIIDRWGVLPRDLEASERPRTKAIVGVDLFPPTAARNTRHTAGCAVTGPAGSIAAMASSMRLSWDLLYPTLRSPRAVSQSHWQSSKRSQVLSSQCRFFSDTTKRGARGQMQNIVTRTPAQPSIRTRTRELSRADLPQDIGLLPGTFIRPLWRDMPSIFEHPQERLRMEWLWIKSAFQNFLGYVLFLI